MYSVFFHLLVLAMMLLADAAPCNCLGIEAGAAVGRKNAKAVYFLTNEAKNSVVALKVDADGTLSDGSIALTGGSGASGIDSKNNATAGPDSLFSQSALKAEGNVSMRTTVSREDYN